MLDGTILVTGGAGFLGSALVWALNQRGYDRILVADILDSSNKWRNLVPLRFDDYLDAADLKSAVEQGHLDQVRTVFHLGACASTTESDMAYLMRNNFEYTKMLAEWALRHHMRFVYASSAATYGGLEGGLSESLDLHRLRPLNPYAYSKHAFDLHAQRHGYFDRMVGLKYFNVFGPNEAHKGDMRSMAAKAFHQLQEHGRVQLFKSERPEFADGCQERDFLYVKDAVAITLHLAEHRDAHGLFNVGSGRTHTWLDLVGAVAGALGRTLDVEFIDMPAHVRHQYQYSTCAHLDRLRGAGYAAPITPLTDAVTDYVTDYLVPDRRLGDAHTAAP